MKTATKIGIVLAGYFGAFLLGAAAVYVRILFTDTADAQASSGMYAFGDAILFVFVFGFASLLPTGFALYCLRPVRRFWTLVSVAAAALALSAVLAAAVLLTHQGIPQQRTLEFAEMFSVQRLFLTPPLAAAFLFAAFFSPRARPRWVLAFAAAFELVAGASWFLSLMIRNAMYR